MRTTWMRLSRPFARRAIIADRPSLICCKSVIGKGLPKQGTSKAHSDAPGWDDVKAAKKSYGADPEKTFFVPDDVLARWRAIGAAGAQAHAGIGTARFSGCSAELPDAAARGEHAISGKLPAGWAAALPAFNPADKPMATRAASGAVIDAIVGAAAGAAGRLGRFDAIKQHHAKRRANRSRKAITAGAMCAMAFASTAWPAS